MDDHVLVEMWGPLLVSVSAKQDMRSDLAASRDNGAMIEHDSKGVVIEERARRD
jgi:hypothetical protein